MSEWQPTKDLKDHTEPVVYAVKRKGRWMVGIAYWTVSQKWNPDAYSQHGVPDGFTHWMPLPDPPNDSTNPERT